MNFETDALGFLISFAKKHRGAAFSAEAVTLSAIEKGVAPQDLRAWGKVFVQASKDGYIARSPEVFRRRRGNGTLTLGWKAV